MRFPLLATTALLSCAALRADDRVIPPDLGAAQRTHLKKFLDGLEKPKQFLPEGAKVSGVPAEGVEFGSAPGAAVKEYLAAVVPHTAADRKKGPEKADLYWFRPNPKKGLPGVTVKRTVDLANGTAAGPPELLFNHATPLAPEERTDAIALARDQSKAVAAVYTAADAKDDVEVAALLQLITATGQADGALGDRVAALQFRKKDGGVVSVMVNLTKGTVRDPNSK